MCLCTISARKPKSEGVGYKCFKITDNGIRGWLYYPSVTIASSKWIKAQESPIKIPGKDLLYTSGFHVFPSLRKALSFWGSRMNDMVVLKVRYKGAHTSGMQDGARTIVARYIKINKSAKNLIRVKK